MTKHWSSLKDVGYPSYLINRDGEVRNSKLLRPVKPQKNKGGHWYVTIYDAGGLKKNVSLGLLVAGMFVHNPRPKFWTTVIHKDGDKENVSADNLDWRTRSYAIRYHQQFTKSPGGRWKYRVRRMDMSDPGSLPSSPMTVREAAIQLGVLDEEIVKSATNGVRTATHNHYVFRFA